MSTVKTWQTESFSSDETIAYGEQVGKNCRGGEVFVLSSDLGGGKTTLTKGIAAGLGYVGTVSSPSFMVTKMYDCADGRKLHHFDFYRLGEAGIVGQELNEAIEDTSNIIVIEWADIVTALLPENTVIITIEHLADNKEARKLTISCPNERDYVIKGIKI